MAIMVVEEGMKLEAEVDQAGQVAPYLQIMLVFRRIMALSTLPKCPALMDTRSKLETPTLAFYLAVWVPFLPEVLVSHAPQGSTQAHRHRAVRAVHTVLTPSLVLPRVRHAPQVPIHSLGVQYATLVHLDHSATLHLPRARLVHPDWLGWGLAQRIHVRIKMSF